jgi:hypothetical protein
LSEAHLQVLPQNSGGNTGGGALVDLEFGSVADFRKRLVDMKQKYNFLQEFFKEIMVKDEDFGTVPGTQKATLYKPGAEKLCELYGFAAHVKSKTEERDFETGYYRVEFTLQLVHRNSGVVVGEGVGECSTFESKYRYRWVSENKVPSYLAKEDLLFELKDIWENGQKTGQSYKQFRIPNEDMFSQWNTVLKMAYKRAYVGLTLQCTRSSGIFTQEEAEMDEYADVPEEDRKKPKGRTANANSGRYQGSGQQQGGNRSNAGQSEGTNAKNRAFELAKEYNGGNMDWNWLGERAAEALGRPIKKVVSDVQPSEWNTVVGYLEQYGHSDIDINDLPEDLR